MALSQSVCALLPPNKPPYLQQNLFLLCSWCFWYSIIPPTTHATNAMHPNSMKMNILIPGEEGFGSSSRSLGGSNRAADGIIFERSSKLGAYFQTTLIKVMNEEVRRLSLRLWRAQVRTVEWKLCRGCRTGHPSYRIYQSGSRSAAECRLLGSILSRLPCFQYQSTLKTTHSKVVLVVRKV